MTAESDALEIEKIDQFYQLVEKINSGSKFSIALSLFVTLSALATFCFSIYYTFGFYSNISDARAELIVSQQRLTVARTQLKIVRMLLGQGGDTSKNSAGFQKALEGISSGEDALDQVSFSIDNASNLLPGESKLPIKSRWFAVVESYADTKNGRFLASARMEEIGASGKCAQLWKNNTGSLNIVTLGGPTDQETAAVDAKLANDAGLSKKAYARLDFNRSWTLLEKSSLCRISKTS